MAPRAAPGADEVLYVPTVEMVQESLGGDYDLELTPNEQMPPGAKKKRRRRRKKRFFEEEALELYGGEEGFLVRTAVIRSRDYDPSRAPVLRSPDDVWPVVQHLQFADQEHFIVLCMNARGKLLAIHESAIGGTASVQVQKQHVIKVPLLVSARSVIVAHNHPSESRLLSEDDKHMSRELAKAFACVDIQLLDSMVISRSGMGSYLDQVGPL